MAGLVDRFLNFAALVVAAVIASFLVRCSYVRARGIHVCTTNVDHQLLLSGQVVVNGSFRRVLHELGTLVPGQTECVWVKPNGESDVTANFTTLVGNAVVIPVVGYVEQGNSGTASADVTADGARDVREDINRFF